YGRIDVVEELSLRLADEISAPVDGTTGWIDDGALIQCFEALPRVQRQVLALRFLWNMETDEIAGTLGLTPTNVRTIQSRAVAMLRAQLNPRSSQVARFPMTSRRRPSNVLV